MNGTQRRDHLWVLFIVAACVLLEVWASWVTIGGMSGFPKIGGRHGISTDWTLAVTTETYWGYALYAWLAAAPGPRSRKFAMWSAAAVFTLSLIGQGAAHLVKPGTVPPPEIVVFVSALPVIVLALIAILIHMRQLDRESAAETRQESAEADERAALRTELAGSQAVTRTVQAELETARAEAAGAVAKAEALTRKLAAIPKQAAGRGSGRKRDAEVPGNGGGSGPGNGRPDQAPSAAPESPGAEAPEDLDSEAKVLWYLDKGYSASRAGVKAGLTDGRGRQIARVAREAPRGIDEGGSS